MSQAIKLLPLKCFHGDRSNKKTFHCQKNAERKICDLRNLFSKTHGFFRWINESPAFLTLFPSAASGSEKEPTVTATATAASGPAARGDGDLWGPRSTNKANLRRVGIKDIHHPQSILQQRMPRSFKKKNMAQSEYLWGVMDFEPAKSELAGTFGVTTPLVRGSFFPRCSQKWLVGTNITFGFLQQQFWYLSVSSKKFPYPTLDCQTHPKNNESPYHLHESVYSLWLLSCKVLHLRISICAQGPRCPEREIGSVGSSKNFLWESFQNRSWTSRI